MASAFDAAQESAERGLTKLRDAQRLNAENDEICKYNTFVQVLSVSSTAIPPHGWNKDFPNVCKGIIAKLAEKNLRLTSDRNSSHVTSCILCWWMAATNVVNQLYSQGAQIDHADVVARTINDDVKKGTKLLADLRWRLFREKLCMYFIIIVRQSL